MVLKRLIHSEFCLKKFKMSPTANRNEIGRAEDWKQAGWHLTMRKQVLDQ